MPEMALRRPNTGDRSRRGLRCSPKSNRTLSACGSMWNKQCTWEDQNLPLRRQIAALCRTNNTRNRLNSCFFLDWPRSCLAHLQTNWGSTMGFSFDSVFGIHEQALTLRAHRAELLASNLTNADTPNYKARDIDFKAVLRGYQTDPAGRLSTSHPQHSATFSTQPDGTQLLYRTPLQPTLNGNTVDTQLEQSAFLQNALAYETTLSFLNSRIQALRLAIRGD